VARLRRSLRELDARRERSLLEQEREACPFRDMPAGKHRFDWAWVLWPFATGSFVIIAADQIYAGWNEASPVLGVGWGLVVALAAAFVVGWIHHRSMGSAPSPVGFTRPLEDELRREREVSLESTVRVDHVDVRAARAWGWFDEGALRLLVLDAGRRTRVFLRGPAIEARLSTVAPNEGVPRRWMVEVLRWTRVVISSTAGGSVAPLQSIVIGHAWVEDFGECEVKTIDELPAELGRAVELEIEA
jgi:hypothetical protein